ncbi:MAG TPA: septal ring lytic transglycosylase RlpA family protein [Bryobacteraceae bacterium]|nr:septal ring lytic transglycosylase RlpA family protein [Bryobacteraceae bacterium]
MLKRPIYGAVAIVAALLTFAEGCGKRVSAHAPSPPKPAPIGWTQTGIASWYGAPYDGRPAASGEIFDTHKLTAAHRSLPFETWVEVTNLQNGERVRVRINDRGPFIDGRIVDLSFAAADAIDLVRPGVSKVRLKVIRAPKEDAPANPRAPADRAPINKDEPAESPNPDAPVISSAPTKPSAPVNPTTSVNPSGSVKPSTSVNNDPPVAIFASAGEFAVQAGAFSDVARADAQAAGLARFGARVVKSDTNPPLWRVLAGRRLTRDSAEGLAAQIRAAGNEAVVVRDAGVK